MIKVIAESDGKKFEETVNDFLKRGFKISSTNCGFANSERYDFCDCWHAVLVQPEDVVNK